MADGGRHIRVREPRGFRRAPAAQDKGESESRGRARTARSAETDLSPASIIRDARTIYVAPNEHVEKKYLEYKLHKYPELNDWG